MRKKYFILIIGLLLSLASIAYGEEYLYFRGFIDQVMRENFENKLINAWNLTSNEVFSLGISGYLIEKDISEKGVLVALQPQDEGLKNIEIVRCMEGRVQETFKVEAPKSIKRVYAKKGDWIYYAYEETKLDFGIMRVNSENICQIYDIRDYVDSSSMLETLVFSISDDGCLAFCIDVSEQDFFMDAENRLFLSQPDGETTLVNDAYARLCCWVDSTNLLYVDMDNNLNIYNIPNREIIPVYTTNDKIVTLIFPQTNICISSDSKLIAYQEYNPEHLFDILPSKDSIWNPLVIVSLESGKTTASPRVMIDAYEFYTYSPQIQFGN